MQRVLATLIRHHSVVRGMVTLLRDGELQVEAVEGFEDRARNDPHSSSAKASPARSSRAASRSSCRASARSRRSSTWRRAAPSSPKQELSFICVPIIAATAQPSARSAVDLRFKPERDYDSSVKFFGVVSSMIAQALNVQRMVEEERRRLLDENTHLRQELRERYDFSNIIGTSGPTRQMYEQVAQVAQTNTTVLIRGESGTGKELIAHAIHYNSLRAKKPFVKVSCAALPDTLIESELFGYEKGAFTGANAAQEGPLRDGRGRHALPRRDRRHQPGHAGEAAARAAGARVRARSAAPRPSRSTSALIAATNKDMEKAIADGHVPRGPLLPPQRVHDLRAAAARAEGRPAAAGRSLPREVLARARQGDQAHLDAGHRHAHGVSLAGQRPRAGERARARGARVRRRGHSRPSPAAVAADRRLVGHGDARVAEGRGRRATSAT